MTVLLIASALAQSVVPSSGTPLLLITVRDGQMMASQIAAVPAQRDAIIAILPQGAAEVTLSEPARLGLIRNRYPGATYRLRHDGPVRVVRRAALANDEGTSCAVARSSIPSGVHLAADDLAPARCQRGAAGGWVAYDPAARSYFARQTIPEGAYLGRLAASQAPPAIEGAELLYRTSEGPVVVEREVVALQSGRAGRPVFVRTEEGKVLSATLDGAEASE